MALLTWALVASSLTVSGAIYFMLFLWNALSRMRSRDRLLEQFPNKPRHGLFGNAKQFPGFNDTGLAYIRDLNRTLPRLFACWDTILHAGLQLKHPDYIKMVLKRSDPKPSHRGMYAFGRPWLGDGLILSNGRKWERHRKLLTKAFHLDILRGYSEVMNDACEIMRAKLETLAADGTDLPLYTTMSLCTLDVMLRCAFSYQNDVQDRGDEHPYVKAASALSRLWLNRATNLVGYLPLWHLTSSGRTFHKHCQYVHSIADEIIQKRRQTMDQCREDITNTSSRKCLDFLDMLLVAKDEDGNGLTDTDIRDEVSTFMFAGHDTTASSLSWTLYELALNPEYQARCQREIDEVLEGRSSDEILWTDLSKLNYLTMCIKEAIRLHSVVPFIMRELKEDIVIDGKLVPKGHTVSIPIYSLHHNPLVWENSMEYQPDRFSPENMEKRDPFSFIPFSAGARNCIGQHFSMNEQKVVLSRILKRFHVSTDPEMELVTTVGITTHPSVNMKLKVTSRK